jgi:hypothetical protein
MQLKFGIFGKIDARRISNWHAVHEFEARGLDTVRGAVRERPSLQGIQ